MLLDAFAVENWELSPNLRARSVSRFSLGKQLKEANRLQRMGES